MRFIYLYSSLTGNTKRLAEAVHSRLHPDSPIYDVAKPLPDSLTEEDAIFMLFYWNDRGTADLKSQDIMKKLCGKKVMALGTLGTYDNGPAAQRMKDRVRAILETNDNQLLAEFCCRGKIDVARTLRRLQKPDGRGLDNEGIIRHLTSHFHPNETDFSNAVKAVQDGIDQAVHLKS
jgi:flavodoxin